MSDLICSEAAIQAKREAISSTNDGTVDQARVFQLKKRAADFREQLTYGVPSEQDEVTLRRLSRQLGQKQVIVKLHLRRPLHATLYLAFPSYLKIAYHLSQEARAGLSELCVPPEFEIRLFDFQHATVRVAAHHVNSRCGVLIGDVVVGSGNPPRRRRPLRPASNPTGITGHLAEE